MKRIIAAIVLALVVMYAYAEPSVIKAFKDEVARELAKNKINPELCRTELEGENSEGYLVSFVCKSLPFKCFYMLHPTINDVRELVGCEVNTEYDPSLKGT